MKSIVFLVAFMLIIPNLKAQGALPSVDLTDLDGEKINTSSLTAESKIVIISFWATWCGPCIEELNNINEIYEDWVSNYNVNLIAISIDDSKTKANVKSLVDGKGWVYTVLLDPNKEFYRALGGPGGPPYTVIIDQNGVIVDKHIGYLDGDEYVLEDAIKELSK